MFSSMLALMAAPLFTPTATGLSCSNRPYSASNVEVRVNHKPINLIRDVTTYELEAKLSGRFFNKNADEGHGKTTLSNSMSEYKNWLISGTSHGNISTNINMEIMEIPQNPQMQTICMFYKKITVDVDYQTNMTIAKELDKQSCEYAAVMDHEMKRHEAYTNVVDAISAKLRENLPVAMKNMESSLVPEPRKLTYQRQMQESVRKYVATYREQMLALMDEYNDVIDAPDALEKLASSCKHKVIYEQHEGDPDVKPDDAAKDYFSKFRKE